LSNVYLAHFAVTDEQGGRFFFAEKLNRAGLKVANAFQDYPYVFNENWSMEMLADRFILRADTPEYTAHLMLTPQKKVTIHGKNGVSQKADCKGCASHYYSITRMKTDGTLTAGDKPLTVQGTTWMDHEFGSNQLTANQVGWDWYSIQLDNNTEVMLYVMRNKDGSIDPNSSGTFVQPDSSVKRVTRDEFSVTSKSKWTSPKSGGTYPMGWHVSVPALKLELDLEPVMKDQELLTTRTTGVTYWEGACKVSGTCAARPVAGQSYVEMTGYAEKFNKRL
jgi:predicted secreted hydrolase